MDDWLKTGNIGNTRYVNVEHKHVSIRGVWQVIDSHSISVKQQETSTRTMSGAERCDLPGFVIHRGDRTKDRRSASPGNLLDVQNINRLHTPAVNQSSFYQV